MSVELTGTVLAIGSTALMTVLGGFFTWMCKLDNRLFSLSASVVHRTDLSEQLSYLISELRATEARLERMLLAQNEMARRRHNEP